MKKWFLAARPWSFPASAMPALTAIAFVFLTRDFFEEIDWVAGVLAAIGAVVFHWAGNLISDYFDYKHNVDSTDNPNPSNRMIVDGIVTPRQILKYGLTVLSLGIVIGLYLTFRCGLPVLYIGLVGSLLTVFYYRLKYSALGDIDILLTFGICIPLGVTYCLTGQIYPRVLAVCLSVGFLVVSILHANNTRDRDNDGKAGIRTFAMIIGLKHSRRYYAILVSSAYLLVTADVLLGILPWTALLVFLTFPIGYKNIQKMYDNEDFKSIVTLDGESAKLVMLFSLVLAIFGCFLPGIFRMFDIL